MTNQILTPTNPANKLKQLDRELVELQAATAAIFGDHAEIRRQRARMRGAEEPIIIDGAYPQFYIGYVVFYGSHYNVFRNSLQPGLFVTPPLANQSVWFADEGLAVRWIEEDALGRSLVIAQEESHETRS